MSIEVTNRSFVLSLSNDTNTKFLHLRCNHNHLNELNRFVRLHDLGFQQLRGSSNVLSNPHRVSSHDGNIEAPNGHIRFELIDGIVRLKPFNGSVQDHDFNVPLTDLVDVLVQETPLKHGEDLYLGEVVCNDSPLYFYKNPEVNDEIVVTDRVSFYRTLFGYPDPRQFYFTRECERELGERYKRSDGFLRPIDENLRYHANEIIAATGFTSAAIVVNTFLGSGKGTV